MSKTTVDIDQKLLKTAKKLTKIKTIRSLIEEGLRELVRKKNREMLREELGTYELDLTREELDKMRIEG
ncbi:MAG: type II toxin-antitoxin system VapB family antitoxin [Deltaproteobacteria bacterium]|nr:type II toxin-antitoxin system VapB family antitoxin [Deltaproteobacteria bacterium]